MANDGRSVVEAKLKPEPVIPKRLTAARHATKNDAASLLSVGIVHVPPHLKPANGHINDPVPLVGGLEADGIWAFSAGERQAEGWWNGRPHSASLPHSGNVRNVVVS
jgi:hypothetical protein